jgi:hypothetical protein
MQENSNENAWDYRDTLFMLVRVIEGVNGGLRTGCCCSRPGGDFDGIACASLRQCSLCL